MLNQELQKDIDIELEKSNPNIKDFIKSKYFKDTLELIYRVHHIDNLESMESLELEIILYLLNISEYNNIDEAIIKEVYGNDVKYSSELDSLINDINIYIIDKSNEDNNINNIYKRKPDEYKDNNIHKDIREHLKDRTDKDNSFANIKEILPEHYKKRDSVKEITKSKPIKYSVDKYREKIDDSNL